jgi:hypothetical protein
VFDPRRWPHCHTKADEEKVPLEKVPKEVMDALKKKFSDAKIAAADEKKEKK